MSTIGLWMGHCQNCVDFRPGKPIRLVKTAADTYSGNTADLAALKLANLDLKMANSGRTLSSLKIVYGDSPQQVLTLSGIAIIATQTDPHDGKAMSQFSIVGWKDILGHLTGRAEITTANGGTRMVDQSSWSEDPSSVGQEFLDIYLKQP